ncbi:MAG: protein kinase domain-containing protein [Candidatus Aminicenantales bacterium]
MKCPHCEHENPPDRRFCSNCASPLTGTDGRQESQTQTLTELPPELERGRLFAGRYQVIEELGSGGMGKVYKVYDTKIQEIVALKTIRPEIASRPSILARFREEIRLARKVTHKNVCRMHDLNEADGISFFTMEYVPGEDLKRILRMMGRLSVGQAVFIARQVCAGLAEAHRLGIIHRDLKSKNVLIDHEGSVRIMDFGLARSLEEKGITGGRAILGTAEYMSPEQAEGEKADNRSDIYSLGVILFEMLTGQTPFEGDSALSVALKHKSEPPPDPAHLNPTIPEKLRKIILQCLEKKREKRFQTIEELSLELESLAKDFPTEERILRPRKLSFSREILCSQGLKKLALPGFALVLVLLIVMVIGKNLWKKQPSLTLPAKTSLIVLPFKNNTGDENLEVWSEALAENLIAELRRSSGNLTILSADTTRTVIRKAGLSQASSFSSEDLKRIAEATGVSHIILGSFSRKRMYYDLKDTHQNMVVGSGREDGQGEEDFNPMSDHMAQKILADLKIPPGVKSQPVRTLSTWANRCYLLGRQAERKYKETRKEVDFSAALSFYEMAKAEDSGFALPYWGLGDLYQTRFVITKERADLQLTLQNYGEAYRIAPDLAGPNSGLGWAYFLQGDNDKAFLHFKRSLEFEPENPSIHLNIGSFFRSIGLLDEAVQFYTKAIELGELSFMTYWLRAACWERLGRYDRVIEDAKRLLEMEPDNLRATLLLARMFISQKNLTEAEREIALAEKLKADSLDLRLTRALLYAVKGEREKALASLEETKDKPVYYSYLLSRIYSLLGMNDEALKTIELGIEKGFEEVQDYLYGYPFLEKNDSFDNLRDDPRFLKILEKQKAVYLENVKKYGAL